MNNNIIDWIGGVQFEREQRINNYTFIPITSSRENGLDYITLKKALEDGVVEIGELEDGASVPEVKVYNKSEKYLILFDGEHLIGAKQNRIINKTIIVEPFSEILIPVSCTEEGRWHHNSDKFSKSDCNATLHMRKASKLEGDHQSEVWGQVNCLLRSTKSISSTSSLHDIYEDISPKIEDMKAKIIKLPSQVGLMIYRNEAFLGLDIINDTDLFSDLYDNLVNGYLLESLEDFQDDTSYEERINPNEDLIEALQELLLTKGESVGAENRFMLNSKNKVGGYVSFRERPVHLALFKN